MNVWLFLMGLIGNAFALLLDYDYEYKPQTKINKILHKIYVSVGIISFLLAFSSIVF